MWPGESWHTAGPREIVVGCSTSTSPDLAPVPLPSEGPRCHDGHATGGIPLPNHPQLPPVRGPGGGRGDPVPGGAEGPAHGQRAPLHGEPGRKKPYFVTELFRAADKDKDNQICFDEFLYVLGRLLRDYHLRYHRQRCAHYCAQHSLY